MLCYSYIILYHCSFSSLSFRYFLLPDFLSQFQRLGPEVTIRKGEEDQMPDPLFQLATNFTNAVLAIATKYGIEMTPLDIPPEAISVRRGERRGEKKIAAFAMFFYLFLNLICSAICCAFFSFYIFCCCLQSYHCFLCFSLFFFLFTFFFSPFFFLPLSPLGSPL